MFRVFRFPHRFFKAVKRSVTSKFSKKWASDAASTRGIWSGENDCLPRSPLSPKSIDSPRAQDATEDTTVGLTGDWMSTLSNVALDGHATMYGETAQEIRRRRREAPIFPRSPYPLDTDESSDGKSFVLWYSNTSNKRGSRLLRVTSPVPHRTSSITSSLDGLVLLANQEEPVDLFDGSILQLSLASSGDVEASPPSTSSGSSTHLVPSPTSHSIDPQSSLSRHVPSARHLKPPRQFKSCPNLSLCIPQASNRSTLDNGRCPDPAVPPGPKGECNASLVADGEEPVILYASSAYAAVAALKYYESWAGGPFLVPSDGNGSYDGHLSKERMGAVYDRS